MLWYPKKPEYALSYKDQPFEKSLEEQPDLVADRIVYWEAIGIRHRIASEYYGRKSIWWAWFTVSWATVSILLNLFNWFGG